MKKTILVLPGSAWQIPLVKKIKEMGHRVLVVNPYENSPCFQYADGHLQSDIFALNKVLAYAKQNKIDAVMSDQCDIAMPLVAKIGKEQGLSALSPEMAALYTDKFLMREFCKKHGFAYPEYKRCYSVSDVTTFLEQNGAPIIIKPLDSNSSHGVFTISFASDIERLFDESISFSKIEKAVIAERYINGTEFTIDGIKTPSRHYTLAISKKHHFEHNRNIADELYFTHQSKDFDYNELKKLNDEFVMASGLQYGFTHAEYKCENGKFYLIEIAARGGGNMISSVITQHMSGYDTYSYLINCALGKCEDRDFSILNTKERAAVLKFFITPREGVVKEITGLEHLSDNPNVVAYNLNFKVGDRIENCDSDSARIGFYIACTESEQELKKTMNEIENGFHILVE